MNERNDKWRKRDREGGRKRQLEEQPESTHTLK
jgi:hypothetical protein